MFSNKFRTYLTKTYDSISWCWRELSAVQFSPLVFFSVRKNEFLERECRLARYDGKGTSTKLCDPRFLIPSITLGPSNVTLQEIGLLSRGKCCLLRSLVCILRKWIKTVCVINNFVIPPIVRDANQSHRITLQYYIITRRQSYLHI